MSNKFMKQNTKPYDFTQIPEWGTPALHKAKSNAETAPANAETGPGNAENCPGNAETGPGNAETGVWTAGKPPDVKKI
jgi:hypothetical protein